MSVFLKPWCGVNIDVTNAIRKDFDFSQILTPSPKIFSYFGESREELFSAEWLNYMDSIGVGIAGALVFWRPSNYQHPTAHVDSPSEGSNELSAALNWCIGQDSGQMVWYNLPETEGKIDQTMVKSNYREWDPETLVEVDRRVIGNNCTLVRVDIPHNIIMSDSPRLLVTARTLETFQNWGQINEYFRPLLNNPT